MWQCPDCKRSFKAVNQSHSCKVTAVEDHFINKSENVKNIYGKILVAASKIGPFEINSVKSAIFLKTSSTFLEIKLKRDAIEVDFCLGREVNEFPVSKLLRLSKNRVAHAVHIGHPDEVDDQLTEWFREAYSLLKK